MPENKGVKLLLISPQTGEIEDAIMWGDRIVRKKSIDSIRDVKSKQTDSRILVMHDFVKINRPELKLLLPELDVYERSIFMNLSLYAGYYSGCVCYRGKTDLTIEDIAEMSGHGREKVAKTIISLIEKRIIAISTTGKVRGRKYFVNPYISVKGAEINPTLKAMFKDYEIKSKKG